MRVFLLLALVFAVRVGAQTQSAADSALDKKAREVASQLRCPVCQGLSINESPVQLAIEMKALVREQLAQGKSPEEVRQYFIDKYGEWVLLEPEPRGLNLLVYALPVLGVLAGALVVWNFVRRSTTPDGPDTGATA